MSDNTFSLSSIGPEPSSATPLEQEDLEGLIPTFVANRGDLNRVEFDNISKALPWALAQTRTLGTVGLLEYSFLMNLHRQMFGDVWKWAGTQRRRLMNIGVLPEQIPIETRNVLDDAKFWHEHGTFTADERAVRLHCRLVGVHPFPNGNGRCTRLMGDLYLVSIGESMFSWGSQTLAEDGDTRERYIAALVKARYDDLWDDLINFARS